MSGFLRHLAARGMGQAAAVHSAARLPYASVPALVETVGEAMAPPPSVRSLSRNGLAQEPAQGPISVRADEASEGTATVAPSQPARLLRGPMVLAVPAAADADMRDDRRALEAAQDRPHRRTADGPPGAIPDPILPSAAQSPKAAAAAADEGSVPLRRIQPLLPTQQGPNGTPLFKAAAGLQGSSWRTSVEETTEVHVSIGRIEVTAVHEAAPMPKRAPARSQRALSLEEYLARRKAGRS